MKPRFTEQPAQESHSEFKGVVKRIAGRLTGDPALEEEGQTEMLGRHETTPSKPSGHPELDPDPHRRG